MIKILIIESDIQQTDSVKDILKKLNYNIDFISNPEFFEPEAEYDLYIIDYQFEYGVSGLEFYRNIRNSGIGTPAILITALQDQNVLIEALRSGVRDFLPKGKAFLKALPLIVQRVLDVASHEKELESNRRMRVHAMETHHRVKNSFQIVHSLLNMELRKQEVLDRDSVANVISHLQGLCLIHDILCENILKNKSGSAVLIKDLIERLSAIFKIPDSARKIRLEINSDIIVNARVSSTLSVIITELLINAIKYGSADIYIYVEPCSENQAILKLKNKIDPQLADLNNSARTGADLVDFLSNSDFKSKLKRQISDQGDYLCEFTFPILEQADNLLKNYRTRPGEIHARAGIL